MAEYDVLRQEILSLFERIAPIAERRKADETIDRLVGARERLAAGRLAVVICGEFKRGKSSLLNALLRQPNLLSVDSFFATRLVTTIGRGDRESVHVTLTTPGGGPPERRRIRREQIGEYAAQGTTNPDADRATLMEIELPDERLASGMLLVDTPGVGGVFADHTRATKQYLPTADALLFVASTEEPLTRSELDFLAEATHAVRSADNPDALLVALTKVDLVNDVDVWLKGINARLAEITGRPLGAVPVLPVSSRLKSNGDALGEPELVAESGFPELEEALWAQLARHRAKVLLGGALAELDAADRALLAPLDAEEAALRDSSQAKIAELEAEAQREGARLAELADQAAPWREQLGDELETLERALRERTEKEFSRVWDRAENNYLAQDEYLRKPDKLADRINGDLGMAFSSVGEWGAKQAAVLQREFARTIGIELAGSALGQLPPPNTVNLGAFGRLHRPTRQVHRHRPAEYETVYEKRKKERGKVAKGFSKVMGWLGGDGGKQWADRTMDSFSPPQYETVEKRKKVRDAEDWVETIEEEIPPHVLAERRDQLRASIRSGRSNQTAQITPMVADVVGDFSRDISGDLDSRIAREQERINDTLPRLRAAATRTAAEADVRLAELAAEQRPLRDLAEECTTLVGRVTRLSGAGGTA